MSLDIGTYSAFTYGHDITDNNSYINFSEDGLTELTAIVEVGSYTLGEFIDAIALALNEIGDNTYTVTLDRATRIITISADAAFWLYPATGTNASISAFPLIGFTTDRTNVLTADGDEASGEYYEPQYYLQRYIGFDDIIETTNARVNQSASGRVEVVSYGQVNFAEFNITFITDITGQNYILEDASGVANARAFMTYLIQKKPVEFFPDKTDENTFTKCILESTPESRDGINFTLKELYSRGLANYYETGRLRFRKLTE